jgi:TonB-dependent SusC/RagA subfamily outer membrane receptor
MGWIRARAAFAAMLLAIVAGCASLGGNPEPIDDRDEIKSSGQGMEELFAGKFPGVEVFRVPTGGISIRIRGSNTFLGSSEPLYIIDGSRVQSGPNGLLFLDPSEIVKIEVLKDIGSTSIYGSDGANGVILITTRRAINE